LYAFTALRNAVQLCSLCAASAANEPLGVGGSIPAWRGPMCAVSQRHASGHITVEGVFKERFW
jgi:hypothetical protein